MKPLNIRPKNPSTIFWKFVGFFVQLNAERPEGYRRDPGRIAAHVATPVPSPVAERKEVDVVFKNRSELSHNQAENEEIDEGIDEKLMESMIVSEGNDIPDRLLSMKTSVCSISNDCEQLLSEEHTL